LLFDAHLTDRRCHAPAAKCVTRAQAVLLSEALWPRDAVRFLTAEQVSDEHQPLNGAHHLRPSADLPLLHVVVVGAGHLLLVAVAVATDPPAEHLGLVNVVGFLQLWPMLGVPLGRVVFPTAAHSCQAWEMEVLVYWTGS